MYLVNGRPDRQLVWYARSGTELGRAATTGDQGGAVSLAPDGKRVAFRRNDTQGLLSLWLQDLKRNQETSPHEAAAQSRRCCLVARRTTRRV